MSFYLWAMRSAAMILFVVALLIVAVTLVSNVLAWHMISAEPQYQRTLEAVQWAQITMSITAALTNAALPLFGAAALWRFDRWFAAQGKIAEAAE